MITYNWKAEFSQEERERIAYCMKHKGVFQSSHFALIYKMANALDRYERILNEQEGDRNHWDEDEDYFAEQVKNVRVDNDS